MNEKTQTKTTKETRDTRLLGKNTLVSNDSRTTGLNNHDMVIGPSGAGKTRGYVMPLLATSTESIIVSDTKDVLYKKYSEPMKARGYKVLRLDLIGARDTLSYNPMDFIRYDRATRRYYESDIRTLASILCPTNSHNDDPFWTDSARTVLESLIAYVLEATPAEEHHFGSVLELFKAWDANTYETIFHELKALDNGSFAVSRFEMYSNLWNAERTASCVRQFVAQSLSCFDGLQFKHVFCGRSNFRFRDMGMKRTVLFINASDCDRSRDSLINLFYSQALQQLIQTADQMPDNRLQVPIRIIFDDFAAGTIIPDFDKIISVIRSREISVSIILQSISQLEGLYGHAQSMTIINNCDHLLYLGGVDVETANYIATKADVRSATILNLELSDCLLFERGRRGGVIHVERADISDLETP